MTNAARNASQRATRVCTKGAAIKTPDIGHSDSAFGGRVHSFCFCSVFCVFFVSAPSLDHFSHLS